MWRILWLAAVVWPCGCFEDADRIQCNLGEKGCQCNDGRCLSDLVCALDYCILPDCTPGTAYCSCKDGACLGDAECRDGAVCIPPDGETESATSIADATDATGTESHDGTTHGGSSTDGEVTEGSTSSDTTDGTLCQTDADCGTCLACGPGKFCVPTVGVPCKGEEVLCADWLWGMQEGRCYRLAAATLEPRCDGTGQCVPASPTECPNVQGDVHFACDPVCVSNSAACASGAKADTVTMVDACALSGTTSACKPVCTDGSASGFINYACSDGECVHTGYGPDCTPFACNGPDACFVSCNSTLECAMFYHCEASACVP